jgi:dienelactone hydrolase
VGDPGDSREIGVPPDPLPREPIYLLTAENVDITMRTNPLRSPTMKKLVRFAFLAVACAVLFAPTPFAAGQQAAAPPQTKPAQMKRAPSPEQMEIAKIQAQIRELEKKQAELRSKIAVARHQRDMDNKKKDDELIAKLCSGFMDFKEIMYKSRIEALDIPAYLFLPLQPRGPKGHPALVWVHGGVHSNFGSSFIPLVRLAVDRGYIVIAPDYRGSTGYGQGYYDAIDYGGYEVDDCISAVDDLKANVPQADMDRVGMIGWSHGGFITLHTLIRDQGRVFKCGYAGVPVTNLVFRLGYKGPNYAFDFVTEKRIGGLPYEKPDIYIERSPLYHVDKIKVPVMVHVATNDTDVNFVEDQQMIHALEYHIPHLAETKVYVDPPGGHSFDRLVNAEKTAPQYTIPQRDSLNRIWTFLETNLKPYLDGEGKVVKGF